MRAGGRWVPGDDLLHVCSESQTGKRRRLSLKIGNYIVRSTAAAASSFSTCAASIMFQLHNFNSSAAAPERLDAESLACHCFVAADLSPCIMTEPSPRFLSAITSDISDRTCFFFRPFSENFLPGRMQNPRQLVMVFASGGRMIPTDRPLQDTDGQQMTAVLTRACKHGQPDP
eukprot:COSAG02_NODE_969_length_15565_cov_9.614833_13_plen_173_part_00